MALLLLFAFIAGIVTVASPCILPVLPIILSAGLVQGRYRPLGIVVGLVCSFTFFTLAVASLIHLFGISPNTLRHIAVVIIILFGLIMIFPGLSNRFASLMSSIAHTGSAIQQEASQSSGFISGFILGIALGLVWTPCAGPILATIVTLVAIHEVNFNTFLVTLAYSIGTGIPMLLIAYGGQYILQSSKSLVRHSESIRKVFGILMILFALAIATSADIAFEEYVLQYFPPINVEDHPRVIEELRKIREAPSAPASNPASVISALSTTNGLPNLGRAPELTGITHWIQSPPLTIASLHGKVVLIDFWTYSCINCIRTLPYITRWYDRYQDKGFIVIGVHTPEFEFEKDTANVEAAIKRFHIHYPVAQDNEYKTWQAYNNLYWPAHYLIDQNGNLRQMHFGEGAYLETENAIRSLLKLPPINETVVAKETQLTETPETYLGYQRGSDYMPQIQLVPEKVHDYAFEGSPGDDEVGIKGQWLATNEFITSKGDHSSIQLNFIAGQVFLVLGGSTPEPLTVLLDGKPLPSKYYTPDMDAQGRIFVKESRHYALINLGKDYGRHVLTILVPNNVDAYVFTFGT
jgi:cytochrome c biogenesis protein CcdA/thiol-disulfide isomerase/thioredoxin